MSEKTEKLAQELADALAEEGEDRGTVEAILGSLAPAQLTVVGNLADIQRIGGKLAYEEGGLADEVPMPNADTIEYEPTSADAPNPEPAPAKAKVSASE